MYASSKSVTAENGKILTPTRTGKFLVDLNGPGILRDVKTPCFCLICCPSLLVCFSVRLLVCIVVVSTELLFKLHNASPLLPKTCPLSESYKTADPTSQLELSDEEERGDGNKELREWARSTLFPSLLLMFLR